MRFEDHGHLTGHAFAQFDGDCNGGFEKSMGFFEPKWKLSNLMRLDSFDFGNVKSHEIGQ